MRFDLLTSNHNGIAHHFISIKQGRESLHDPMLEQIDLPDTTLGDDVAGLVGEQYVKGMSFGMLLTPTPVIEAKTKGDQNILEISQFVLDEVSVLARPAFTQISIDVKADPSLPDATEFGKLAARRERVRKERVAADRLQAEILRP